MNRKRLTADARQDAPSGSAVMSRSFTVLVVDDHPIVRKGIATTFAEQDGFTVVGEGASSDDAIAMARQCKPDLVLLDMSMPGGGVEAITGVLEVDPDAKILILSVKEDAATVRAALRAGAKGYIPKGVSGEDLIGCAQRVLAGEGYVSPALAARLLNEPDGVRGAAPALPPLTERENQIFELLGRGLSNSEIGQRLGLSDNTVKHYITPLLHKLGVRNRTEAALMARREHGTD